MATGIDPLKGRWYGEQHRFYNPYNIKEDADKVLEEWDDVCNQLEIPHLLIYGTCLGFYREGSYILNDNDIDVAVICTEGEYAAVVTALREIEFHVAAKYCFKRELLLCVDRIPETPQPWFAPQWEACPSDRSGRPFTFESLDIVTYNGRTYNVPHPVESYLEWAYGDWRTPKRRGA